MQPLTIAGSNRNVPERVQRFLEQIENDVKTNQGLSNTPWCQFGADEPLQISKKGIASLHKKYESGRIQSFLLDKKVADDFPAILEFLRAGIEAGAISAAFSCEMFVWADEARTQPPDDIVVLLLADPESEWRATGQMQDKEIVAWHLEETNYLRPQILASLALQGHIPILEEDAQIELIQHEIRKAAASVGFDVPTDDLERVASEAHARLLKESIKVALSKEQQCRLATLRSKTRRNSPCPCGSGKKFKKCCLLRNGKHQQI